MTNLSKEEWVLFNVKSDMENAEGDNLYFLGCILEVIEAKEMQLAEKDREIERLEKSLREAHKKYDILWSEVNP